MAEAGVKDSEGHFTVSARLSAEKLKEQYAQDLLLGYTELLQGFRELGARSVRIIAHPPGQVELLAQFPGEGPDLSSLLLDPLNILSANHALHSGTGLLLLQHADDEVWFSRWGLGEPLVHWRFRPGEAAFELTTEAPWATSPRKSAVQGPRIWRFMLRAKRLALFPRDRLKCWRDTPVAQEFADRMAFYGLPTICAGELLQTPLPGRLVPGDFFQRHQGGPTGYSWEPLAFELVAGLPESSMSFLSEPFTGTIAEVVSVDGQLHTGYGSGTYPDYVSFKGIEQAPTACVVPFQKRRFFGSGQLTTPGFQRFPSQLINPRQDGGMTRVHCWGHPLFCSRLTMLSTALGGPSTVVFLRHGAVLGGRHEDLGVPGTLCLIGTEGLSTDLSRRTIRRDKAYLENIARLRRQCLAFAAETEAHLPAGHWARQPLRRHLSLAR
jgi:hypothetical protein